MAIDPKLLEELESRRNKIKYAATPEKYEARHAKGDWTARERMSCLFDAGSFCEIGMHTKHNCSNFGMLKKDIPGDGIVTGYGLVNGRPVAATAADFLAQGGSLENIDLQIKDMTTKEIIAGNMTAANFGKVSDVASKADLALGIINLVFETAAMMSIFAGRSYSLRDIVLTGNLAVLPQAQPTFDNLSKMFDVNFRIPKHARYATVIGAALSYFDTIGALS
jgi:hypothetical protein